MRRTVKEIKERIKEHQLWLKNNCSTDWVQAKIYSRLIEELRWVLSEGKR